MHFPCDLLFFKSSTYAICTPGFSREIKMKFLSFARGEAQLKNIIIIAISVTSVAFDVSGSALCTAGGGIFELSGLI